MPQGGTNIGAALLLSRQVLESADRGAKDKVVVLISDGEDLEGEITEGVDALKEGNVKVLAVGIGSETGEPIPLLNKRNELVGYKKDETGATVMTRLDRAGLERIAEATGGQFFYQPKSVAMGQVVQIIDKMHALLNVFMLVGRAGDLQYQGIVRDAFCHVTDHAIQRC